MQHSIIPTDPSCEITSSRVVNAPIDLAFRAWTEPIHLKEWWGPDGFTNTFLEYDLRPGGKWRFIMHGPDKGNYPNEVEFISIDRPHLLFWKRHSKPLFKVLVRFEEVSEAQTKITFKMLFDTPKECNKLKPYVVDKNEQNFDRLERELTKMSV